MISNSQAAKTLATFGFAVVINHKSTSSSRRCGAANRSYRVYAPGSRIPAILSQRELNHLAKDCLAQAENENA